MSQARLLPRQRWTRLRTRAASPSAEAESGSSASPGAQRGVRVQSGFFCALIMWTPTEEKLGVGE